MIEIGPRAFDPAFVDVVLTAALDGSDRRRVDAMFAFESGYADVALVGDEVLVHDVWESLGGAYALADGSGEPSPLPSLQHGGEGAVATPDDPDAPYTIDGAGVDGDRLAVVERTDEDVFGEGRLVLLDLRSEQELSSRPLMRPGPAGIPVGLDGDIVVLVESLDDGSSRSWLLGLETGESTSIDGVASLSVGTTSSRRARASPTRRGMLDRARRVAVGRTIAVEDLVPLTRSDQ